MTPQQAIQYLQSIPDDIGIINLNKGESIVNMRKFKETHIIRMQHSNPDGAIYESTLNRIINLYHTLNSKINEKTEQTKQTTENKETGQQTLSLF